MSVATRNAVARVRKPDPPGRTRVRPPMRASALSSRSVPSNTSGCRERGAHRRKTCRVRRLRDEPDPVGNASDAPADLGRRPPRVAAAPRTAPARRRRRAPPSRPSHRTSTFRSRASRQRAEPVVVEHMPISARRPVKGDTAAAVLPLLIGAGDEDGSRHLEVRPAPPSPLEAPLERRRRDLP